MSAGSRTVAVDMVAACPFPANHGSPASIREMSAALTRRGHTVHVVTYPMGQPLPVGDVTIHRVAPRLRGRPVTVGPTPDKPLLDLLLALALVRCVRRHHIEVIHAHNYEAAIAGALARRLTGRPLLYNAVNTMSDELPGYRFIRPRALARGLAALLDTWVPRAADHITVVSEELRRFLVGRGIEPERITLVPAGVDPEMFDGADPRAVRSRLGLGEAPVVLYTGTLDPFQRLDYLLRATAAVADKVPDARLVLAANIGGPGLGAVRTEARRLGIADRVVVVHPAPLEDLPALLAAADVAVCPRPDCPGFPVKLLNYMAAARPIVTFRSSAKSLRHLETAFLAEDHDVDGLAQGIVALLQDRALAADLGRRARAAIAGALDWPSLARRIEDVYRGLLDGRRSPGPRAGP